MKKILALMLILGMASAANAVLSLTVDGVPAPAQIELQPSDWIVIGLDVAPGFILGEVTIQLSNEQGSLDPANMVFNPDYINVFIPGVYTGWAPWDFQWLPVPGAPVTPTHIELGGGNFSGATAGDSWVMQDLMFHCEEPTDVIIDLIVSSPNGLETDAGVLAAGTILDSIYVIQPEPTTIALLSLGGLLLRRRRK